MAYHAIFALLNPIFNTSTGGSFEVGSPSKFPSKGTLAKVQDWGDRISIVDCDPSKSSIYVVASPLN